MTLSREILRSYVCGLPGSQRESRLLAMLTGYLDDSGTDRKGPVFVLSGYVSTVQRWEEFSDDWSTALISGPKPLAYFKMQEASFSNKGEFKGWSKTERDKKIMECAAIVKRHAAFGIAAVLWWKDFSAVQKEYKNLPINPYALLFQYSMAASVRHVIDFFPSHEKIKFIFDDQGKTGDFASATYRLAQSMFPKAMLERVAGPPSHENDKTVLPLQAADMIAWNHRRYCEKNEHHGTNRKNYIINPCMNFLDEIPTVPVNLHTKALKSFFEKLKHGAPVRIRTL